MSSEEKIEASSKPEEQQASEEQPTAVEKEPTATKDEQPKPDPSSEAEKQRGEESEPAAAAEQEATEEEEPEEEEPDDGVPIVLVTGASGFIATHLIKQLLEQGRYRVRGSVRSKKRQEKVQPLLELVADPKYPLRLVEADLSKPDSWKKAVKRCTYVFHVASPFPAGATDEAVIVRTAVEGTTNVLQACADAGTIKRVVVTSSIAAVSSGTAGSPGNPPDYVYTEKDWSVESACGPYVKSKLKAEQAAWEFVKQLDESKRFELVVVNPAYVQGPLLSANSGEGSKELCQRLLNGKMPGIPDVSMPLVDVRDVAAAHIAAMEKSEAAGNRYILSNRTLHFREIAQVVGDEFRPQGYKIASKGLPKVVMWVGKFFDAGVKQMYSLLGKTAQLSNDRMVNELEVTLRPVEESVIDTCYSLVELGLAKKTPGYLGHPSKRPPPPPTEKANDDGQAAKEEGQKTEEAKPEGATGAGEKKSDEKPAKGATESQEKPQAASEEGKKNEDVKPEDTETSDTTAAASQEGEEKPDTEEEKKSEEQAASGEKTADEGEKPVEEEKPADEGAGEKPVEEEKPADEGAGEKPVEEEKPTDDGEKPATEGDAEEQPKADE